MKVEVSMVGTTRREPVRWPEDWPIPCVGDDIEIPGVVEVSCVRTVVWYPEGSDEDDEYEEPFVYIVIGPRPPR